jgi:general stress protein YciG
MKRSDLSKYMAEIGAKGGQAGGKRKARDPEHYRKMVAARNKQRAKK